MMLLMAATRHLRQVDRHVHAGGWQDQWRVDTPTISGKRLGVLGMGTIGGKIAHRAARGFDMEVGYHNRRAVAGSPYRYFDNLVELANWAEFLVCAAPGARGRDTSSTLTCSLRSGRRAISSTSDAAPSWTPRRWSMPWDRSASRGRAWTCSRASPPCRRYCRSSCSSRTS